MVEPGEPERDAGPWARTEPQIRRALEQGFRDVGITAAEQRIVEIAQRAAGYGGEENVVVASRIGSRLQQPSYDPGIAGANRHQERLKPVARAPGIRSRTQQQIDRAELPLVDGVKQRRPPVATGINDVWTHARGEQTLHGREVAGA